MGKKKQPLWAFLHHDGYFSNFQYGDTTPIGWPIYYKDNGTNVPWKRYKGRWTIVTVRRKK